MRKINLLLVLAVLMMLTGTAWAGVTADELMSVVDDKGGLLTRGEYARMLVVAAGMEENGYPEQTLVTKGILKGYPDDGLRLEQGISRLEAVSLAARALGLTDAIAPPEGVAAPLDKSHWGYNLYAWFIRQGLVEDNPEELLSEEQGAALLQKVFNTDPEVVSILEQSQAKTSKQYQSVRTVMSGSMQMVPRAGKGADAEDLLPPASVTSMEMVQEMVLPDKLHQTSTMTVQIQDVGTQEITTEIYMVDGEMYQKIPVEENGSAEWYRFPTNILPDMEQLMENAEQQLEAIPPELEEFFHYQLLGTTELNGETVYEVAFYGRVDDFNKFIEASMGRLGGNQEFLESMGKAASLLDTMSYWGIEFIGMDDFLPRAAEYTSLVTYREELDGEPVPMEALQTYMKVEEYSYGEDITIELPAEAVDAPELPMSEPSVSDDPTQ